MSKLKLALLALLLVSSSPAWAQDEFEEADLDAEEADVDTTTAHLLVRKVRVPCLWEQGSLGGSSHSRHLPVYPHRAGCGG